MIINNMFSIFDPSSYYFSSSWIILISTPFLFNNSNFLNNENVNLLMNSLSSFITNELNQMINNKSNLSSNALLAVFLCLSIINVIAIYPYNFTVTAHMSISFTISASIWLTTMIFGWNNQFNSIIIHLTPLGTPDALINFIVIIETISAIIRPITLSIRLSANIVAGHLLITLLSSFSLINEINITLSVIVIGLLIALETGVAIVQAYVFITLILLYQNETS